MKNRFAALDGLRALAVLGVIWIHSWTTHGNPRFFMANIDITSILALGGNGVDLFFVISGFCMYYFYANNKTFSYYDFWLFIKKRWIRLSPAYYLACLVYIIIMVINAKTFPVVKSAASSFFYLNSIFYNYSPQSILWSLTVEWQFYIIIPFLLIYQNIVGFKQIFCIIAGLMLLIALLSIILLKSKSDFLTWEIIFRYFEFMWGILIGKILLKYSHIQLKHRLAYLLSFILITYVGRILISRPVLSLLNDYYNIFKLSGFALMGIGFAGIIYLALTSKKWLKLILGNPVFSFIGRISFSMYLWHALIFPIVGKYIMANLSQLPGITAPMVTFCFSVIILIPLSTVSFYLLEKPFMARNNKK